MKIRRLETEEIVSVYHEYMERDFHTDELRPLNRILEPLQDGIYECTGMFDDGILTGYAFFVKLNKDYLLDYFAIVPDKRNQGYGSKYLALIEEYLKDSDSFLIEVENPLYAADEQSLVTMQRRKEFYLKNGCYETGVFVNLFGVEYEVLKSKNTKSYIQQEIKDLYRKHYRTTLPDKLYSKYVHVK